MSEESESGCQSEKTSKRLGTGNAIRPAVSASRQLRKGGQGHSLRCCIEQRVNSPGWMSFLKQAFY